MPKQEFHIRLSEEGMRLLRALAEAKGIPMTNCIEIAIRELAKKEQIT